MTLPIRHAREVSAGDYPDAAPKRTGRSRGARRAIGCGLRLLSRLTHVAEGQIDGWETAELAAIYDTLAGLVAEALNLDVTDALGALAALTGAHDLFQPASGRPELDLARPRPLCAPVLWITVTYETGHGGRGRRVTEVAYQDAAGDPRTASAAADFGAGSLPGRARERMRAGGQRAVRYQLYPAPAPA